MAISKRMLILTNGGEFNERAQTKRAVCPGQLHLVHGEAPAGT